MHNYSYSIILYDWVIVENIFLCLSHLYSQLFVFCVYSRHVLSQKLLLSRFVSLDYDLFAIRRSIHVSSIHNMWIMYIQRLLLFVFIPVIPLFTIPFLSHFFLICVQSFYVTEFFVEKNIFSCSRHFLYTRFVIPVQLFYTKKNLLKKNIFVFVILLFDYWVMYTLLYDLFILSLFLLS